MRINPAGNHVQVGIDAVKHGNPFPIDVFVSHADPAEMIANQLGHGAACIFGQLFQRLKFRVRKPDPQHVGVQPQTDYADETPGAEPDAG